MSAQLARQLPAVADEQEETLTHGLPTVAGASGSLAVSLARAEVDQQIATARAMPRSIHRAMSNILTLATLDEQAAEECVYALPRSGKSIKGPSVRLAEIIASQWGNARVGARVVHVDRFEKYVEAEGVFHDLETNLATTARVRRRISDKHGRLLNDDMIVVTGNAACSIAKRNAILGGVPKAVWRKAYDAVESVLAGDVKTLAERRDHAFKAFAAFGVTPEQLYAALEIGGADDLTLDHLVTLTGMRSALKNGEATVEEMFPPPPKQAPAGDTPRGLAGKLDKIAGQKAPKKAGAEAAKPEHDPETGEIKPDEKTQESASPPGETDGSAGAPTTTEMQGGAPAADPQGDPRDELMALLRRKASKGAKALKLAMAKLTEDDLELLTDADHAELTQIAEAAAPADPS